MSIRPVDTQLIVHKSSELSRVNQNENNRRPETSQQFATQLEKGVRNEEHQINRSDKPAKNSVYKDGKGSKYNHQHKNKNNNKKEEKPSKPKDSSVFDVSI